MAPPQAVWQGETGLNIHFTMKMKRATKVKEVRLQLDTRIFPLNILAVSLWFVNKSTHSRHFI